VGRQLKKVYFGAVLVILSALGFSILPLMALYAYNYKISVSTLLLIRFSTASVIFFVYIALFIKKTGITGKSIVHFILLGGVCYTLQSTFYFNSVKFISPSLAVLMLYTFPIFVSVLSYLFFGERLGKRTILAMVLSFSGLLVITATSMGKINFTGIILGVLAAITYSVYIVLGNHVIKQIAPVVTSAFVTLFAALGIFLVGFPSGNINFNFDVRALLPVAAIALFSTVLAIFTFFKGLEYLGPTKASILSMLEPIFTIALTAVFLKSNLNILQSAGGMIVLAGALFAALSQKNDRINLKKETSDNIE
jgi:drug/metabolite transporter (DMT)-like permease